ncbi:MAG: hypothetical protein U0838_06015 [Chloroflexota bacterium]
MEVVGEADGCEPGLAQIERLQPDASCSWTSGCRGLDGLQCLEEIKKLEHPVAVVIVTLYNSDRPVRPRGRSAAAPRATSSRRRARARSSRRSPPWQTGSWRWSPASCARR